MYCPNCGKDCGNSNFCPNCGKKLSVQSAAPSAWAPGMACPHCGGTKLQGKYCAFCGAQLLIRTPSYTPKATTLTAPKRAQNASSSCVPEPTFQGLNGYISIPSNGSIYIVRNAVSKPTTFIASKDQIVSIVYSEATASTFGYIAIRTREHNIPVQTLDAAAEDVAAILFDEGSAKYFAELYASLSIIANNNKAKRLIYFSSDESSANPYRNPHAPVCPACCSNQCCRTKIRAYKVRFPQERPHRDTPIGAVRNILRNLSHYFTYRFHIKCQNCGFEWTI